MNCEPEAYWVDEPVDSIAEPAKLARAIACVSPVRLGHQSRARELLVAAQAELVYLLPRVALALVVAMLFGIVIAAPRTMKVFVESKADVAKATVKKYAFEAYPSWRAQHESDVCPDRLDALNEWMNNKDVQDPWGGYYEMSCSDFGMVVWTAGEDGRPGTADDIRSDR